MKTAEWYYKEFNKVEKQIKLETDPKKLNQLNIYLDKLHDEFSELD